jgi:very-short-patch-repair endonuclease
VPSNDERERARELRDRAREMRANPTPAERRLWSMLRDRRMPSFKFKRQHVIAPYIVDFACLERRLIIEADGGQHADSISDRRRDAYLKQLGFRILRFWNNDVLENPRGVFEMIYATLHTPHPPTAPQWAPPSPLLGEGHGDLNA